ncbi:MAG: cytochrome P460 family protein [Anaerolineae bacterium]
MDSRRTSRAVVLVACIALVALLSLLGSGPDAVQAQQGPTPSVPSPLEAPLNEALAIRLWVQLQNANYRQEWDTIPGKGTFYQGQDPHGALLSTYLNPGLIDEIRRRPGVLPNSATLVLESYTPERTLESVAVMQKQAGYNAGHNDWFWAEYGPDGTVRSAGRVPGCIACHGGVWSNDYVYSFPVAVLNPSLPNPGQAGTASSNAPLPGTSALIAAGAAHVERLGCRVCHSVDGSAGLGPSFLGLFGSNVFLQDGTMVMADEAYLRDSILEAHRQAREGFPPALMPDYSGRITPAELDAIVEYLKSLSGE